MVRNATAGDIPALIELGARTFHRELVALVRRAQRQPALDCLLECLRR